MFNKCISLLFIILTVVCCVIGAPVHEEIPPRPESRHITKEDVLLLKEKLEALEADLAQLEPVVPAEAAIDEEGGEEDVEAADQGDNEEEEVSPPAEVETPQEDVPLADEDVVTVPDNQHDDEETDNNPDEVVTGEEHELEDEEDEEGEVEEEEEEMGDFVPYRNTEEQDIYLRKLIIEALTVLYRKDADRIDKLLRQYYSRIIAESEDFPQNAQPAPQVLSPNTDDLGGNTEEEGAFIETPFIDDELDDELHQELHEDEVLAIMDARKKQELDNAEQILADDIKTFQDKGLTVEELLKDLEDKQQAGGQRPGWPSNDQEVYAETEEAIDEATFGQYKEGGDDVEVVNDQPMADTSRIDDLQQGLQDDTETKYVVVDDEEDAGELLEELMANLNNSFKNYEEHKALSQHE